MADAEMESGGSRMAKDLLAGAAGGVAQVLMGQPFDIVKVRLQTSTAYTNAVDCAAKTWKNEGPLAFYKGTLTPLIGIGACVSVQFGAFHTARRYFASHNPASSPALSYTQFYLSGAFAGLSNTLLSSPIEHVRIRLQTQPSSPSGKGTLYTSPLDCIRQLSARSNGGLTRGLYRGTSVTWFREAQAYGVWFLSFEFLMAQDLQRNWSGPSGERAHIPGWKVAVYGGLAGEALWISSYPFDVVKSKMQSDGFAAKMKYRSALDCARQILAVEGLTGFWKGVGPTLLRALPVSAGTFAVVEATMRALN